MKKKSEKFNAADAPTFDDAIALLKSDHRAMDKAFADFEKLADGDHAAKKKLADHICEELTLHMTVEEELFYPEIKQKVEGTEDLVNEGVVEHSGAKVLIKEIKAMKGDEELFDTKVMVLAEQIEHHVKEEETEMFPKVIESRLDIVELGTLIEQRKLQLQSH